MTVNSLTQAANAVSPYDDTSSGSSTSSSGSSTSSSGSPSAGASADSNGVTENQFLTLLVTQLKNQDPLNPTDSDQFMSELAQFSQLQEVIGVHQDLNSLLQADNIQVPNSSTD
jgi:flagellar basal-body rod modification protein FlgD